MIPVYFHPDQASFRPRYEWALGKKLEHPETTRRVESIWRALESEPEDFDLREPDEMPLHELLDAHAPQLLTLYKTARELDDDHTFHPSVFPQREDAEVDPTNIHHSGFFCFDSGTPLNNKTWTAAYWSAASAFAAAKLVESGTCRTVYSMSRPPGHHASRRSFGGYCYFNNVAIAARQLRTKGRVAVVDVDFHHGNGTQELFYTDGRVLTISIHGDPSDYFPFFSGFPHESGRGMGEGYNTNIVLPKGTRIDRYLDAVRNQVVPLLERFEPAYLIVAAGFDTYHDDPIGAFSLRTEDFATVGNALASLDLPTVIVQEGGYDADHLGKNVVSMLKGFLGKSPDA